MCMDYHAGPLQGSLLLWQLIVQRSSAAALTQCVCRVKLPQAAHDDVDGLQAEAKASDHDLQMVPRSGPNKNMPCIIHPHHRAGPTFQVQLCGGQQHYLPLHCSQMWYAGLGYPQPSSQVMMNSTCSQLRLGAMLLVTMDSTSSQLRPETVGQVTMHSTGSCRVCEQDLEPQGRAAQYQHFLNAKTGFQNLR